MRPTDAGVSLPALVDVDQDAAHRPRGQRPARHVFVDADGQVVGRHLGALTEDELTREIEDRYGITA
jgi:hypothetical protein